MNTKTNNLPLGKKLVQASDGETYWCHVPNQLTEELTKALKLRPKQLLVAREATAQELRSV